MICKCGHDESQHGPAGYHRLCAYCLCNRFQPTEQAEDERLREALHKKLDRVLGFFNRHDPEEHRYVTEGGARAIVVGVLAALATQEPTAQKRTGRPVSSGEPTLDDLLREHCDAMKEHYGAMSIAYNAACEVREAATDYTPQWHERDESRATPSEPGEKGARELLERIRDSTTDEGAVLRIIARDFLASQAQAQEEQDEV